MKKIIWPLLLIIIIAGVLPWYLQKSKIQSPMPNTASSDQDKAIVNSDVKKVADFATYQVDLELYYEKFKKYPKAVGDTPETRWQNLSDVFVKEYASLGFTKPISLRQDPRQKVKGYSYDYQTDPNQENAVLKATLEAPDDAIVKRAVQGSDDVDGIIYNLDCNKPSYCVISKHRQ